MKYILLVGIGGFLGAVSRYLVGKWLYTVTIFHIPWATLLVNLSGSFLIGVILGLTTQTDNPSENLKLLLATGFCGAFTTFSTFSFENLILIKEQNYLVAIIYTSISFVGGLLLAWGGFALAK
ncbi:fluoride efflux transporter CrcB [Marinigracilibium pacificum]|uniref:Fluoride-specific ion channel FluC n=1 Tax=Marinigracilibium pacificum TaxID=2729599 RepID=A0A848J112_9BACT|nr:fluoride efflux transporter CrcB [Marinigracilibium pacificum]NMM49361.1 fluoride efflux transporter CrcB [Marinigracilibium pacificum]